MKHARPQIMKLVSVLAFAASILTIHADVIADFEADFNPAPPNPGWAYYWNPAGVEIGNHSGYVNLVSPGGNWQLVVDENHKPGKDNTLPNAQWLRVKKGQVTPGNPAFSSTDDLDHYVICAYTIQAGEAGPGRIINSRIARESQYGSGQIRIYINDHLLGSDTLDADTASSFNIELGRLKEGDTIYIAYGPDQKKSGGAKIQFQIETN